jgi:DMSO/TMAO reductase YedYZ molybdopterin-dependent catalytic subunit
MSSAGASRRQYGLSTDLFVSHKESDQTVVLGGVGQGSQRWVHVMTRRAAQVMWFKLTSLLYPEKADLVTALASTAPLRAPANNSVTTHAEVVQKGNGYYTVIGWVQRNSWVVMLDELDARRLWASLDLALFPVGWEGRETKPKKLN